MQNRLRAGRVWVGVGVILGAAMCGSVVVRGARGATPTAAAQASKVPANFLFGISSPPNDRWLPEVRSKGAKFDIRYQYLAGGVNTSKPWSKWDAPAGQFVLNYFQEADRDGVMPCLTYYQMYQSLPTNGKGDEARGNKSNCENASTMKAYLEDIKLVFQKAGEYGKPVLFHHEPDLWGYMCINPAFAPNDPDRIKVMVKSSGFAEAASFDDTAAGFGKCIIALRDKYAPKVVLAWHASKWGNPDPHKTAAFLAKCGQWDLIFTDLTDRDAGWKVAHHQDSGAWWTEQNFNNFRDWGGELHKQTGMPIVAWQVPIGNTIMASCNNTDGHFMDNRAQYFLEGYPENKHIAQWAERGFVGILFGGGAANCTDVRDVKKDGVTNPTPVKDNAGEKATVPDDDGGYLRSRIANYYEKKPVSLK